MRTPIAHRIAGILLFLTVLLTLASCSLEKQTMKQLSKDAQYRQRILDWAVKQDICKSDTFRIVSVKDTTIYKDTGTTITVQTPFSGPIPTNVVRVCPDLDTTLANGAKVRIRNGLLYVTVPFVVPQRIIEYRDSSVTQDRSKEQALARDTARQGEEIRLYKAKYKDARSWLWWFIASAVLNVLLLILAAYIFFRRK